MAKAKIVKCEDASGQHWFHVSVGSRNTVYRQLTSEGLRESQDEPRHVGPEMTVPQAKELFSVDSLSTKPGDKNNWIKLFKKLQSHGIEKIYIPEEGKISVPRTRLRTFRFAFRDWTTSLKRSQAKFFADNVDCLAELWKLSLKEMAKYDCQKPFHESKRTVLDNKPKSVSKIQNTIDAGVYFATKFKVVQPIAGVAITYLDREIAPLRTPGGQFVGGGAATSSGRGGMDLLLMAEDRVCAGEIKVGNDSELFEALLQAMWYGSEIATKQQIARVDANYPLGKHAKSTVDVAVFSLNQDKDDPTRDATVRLVDEINSEKKFKNLGRIHLFENVGDQWKAIR